MISDRKDIPRLQSDFFRDQFHKMLRWLIVSVFIIFILIALILFFLLAQPRQYYYANTSEGRILDMPPTM
jgi:hypothetical protein